MHPFVALAAAGGLFAAALAGLILSAVSYNRLSEYNVTTYALVIDAGSTHSDFYLCVPTHGGNGGRPLRAHH